MATPVTATKAPINQPPNTTTKPERPEVIEEGFLEITPQQDIPIPMHATVIGAQMGATGVRLYYRCNPALPAIGRTFVMLLCGQPIPGNDWRYIGTVIASAGIPHHIFEKRA